MESYANCLKVSLFTCTVKCMPKSWQGLGPYRKLALPPPLSNVVLCEVIISMFCHSSSVERLKRETQKKNVSSLKHVL